MLPELPGGALYGNTFVGGYYDGFLFKLDNNGNRTWVKQFGTDGTDIFLVKFDSSGTRLQTIQYGTSSHEAGKSIAIDNSDNIYVTGDTSGNLEGNTGLGITDIFFTSICATCSLLVKTSFDVSLGSVSPTWQSVEIGQTTMFNVEAAPGYKVDTVDGCGGIWSGTTPYITGALGSDCTVSVSFALQGTPGDVNQDGSIGLADAVLALQVVVGMIPTDIVDKGADVNADGKIGIAEAIYAVQSAVGIP